jgi:hypothetical protein
MADFVAEIGDHNSEAADRDFLRRSLPYAPLGAGFDAVAPTPAAVTQHAQWLVLVVVGRPSKERDVPHEQNRVIRTLPVGHSRSLPVSGR